MAIEIQQEKKGNPLLLIIIILLVGVLLFWIVKNLIQPADFLPKPKQEEVLPSPLSSQVMNAKLDINEVINNTIFKTLSAHISWPLPSVPLGKQNIFQP